MHQLKWEWDSLTTLNQFVASFVNPFRSKMSEVLFIRTTEDYMQLSTIFIYNPTRDILLLTLQIVIIRLIVAASYSTA